MYYDKQKFETYRQSVLKSVEDKKDKEGDNETLEKIYAHRHRPNLDEREK